MSTLRLEGRLIGSRTWYRLLRDDGLIAMGGLRSPAEAEAWAMEAGHTLVDAPGQKSTAAPNLLGPSAAVDPSPGAETGGVPPAPAPAPGQSSEGVRPDLPRRVAQPAPAAGTIWETHGTGKWHSLPEPPMILRRTPPKPVEAWLTKDAAKCCLERRLPDGRPVIGYCSPECVRRPARRTA